jgi:hypothetical protein
VFNAGIVLEPGCSWDDGTKNYAISGYNDVKASGVTLEGCMEACANEETFECKSIDYKEDSMTCYLSSKGR